MNLLKNKDIWWSASLVFLALLFCIITKNDLFSASILISGIFCVSLIAVGRKEGYIFGLYNSFAYGYLAYENGLLGEATLNFFFFVPTAIIGFFMWNRKMKDAVVLMRKLKTQEQGYLLLTCMISTLGLGLILARFDAQNTPYIDATTNVLSIIATFLMLWRYSEQWLLYIALNIVTIAMWYIRFQADGEAADTMIFMWILYLVNSIYGWIRWNKGSARNETNSELSHG